MTSVMPVLRRLILLASTLILALAFVPVYADAVADRGKQQAMINLLVRAGKSEEAATAMRALYPNGPPLGGELALEYYDVVGNTDKGWAEAKNALEKLVKAAPEDVSYRLAFAKQLARRAATRRNGLQMFVELSGQPDIKQQVLGEWRSALGGLDNSSDSIKLYQDYLKVDPDNNLMLDALARLKRAEAKRLPWQMRDKADAQLAAGHPEEAITTLKKALQLDPENAWVRFDLSRLYHKQGNKAQGRALMEEGMSVAPGNADILYANAMYVSLLDEPEHALRLLGKIPVSQRSPAMRQLKQKLTIQLQTQQTQARDGRQVDAQATVEPAGAGRQSGQMRDEADAQLAAGHPQAAITILKNALQLAPKSAWVRFDLSRLYHKQGNKAQGRALMEEGMSIAPNDADILYANALYLSLLDEASNALNLLEKIPAGERSPAMQRLKLKMTIQAQTQQALVLAHADKRTEMLETMRHAEADAGGDEELVNIVANAWFDLNDPARGVALMQRLAEQPSSPIATRLYYARLLNRAERDVELAAVLEKLSATGELTDSDKEDLHYLKVSLTARSADNLRHAGNLAAAKALLAPALKQDPENADLLQALARVHVAAHEPQQARDIYQRVLQRTPDNVSTRMALVKAMFDAGDKAAAQQEMATMLAKTPADNFDTRMAIADLYIEMGDLVAARTVAEQSRGVSPDNPRVLVETGHIALAERHYDEAIADFQQANAAGELADMERHRAKTYVETGFYYLSKQDGSPGISNLISIETPIEMHVPAGYGGEQVFVQVDPVRLNAGQLSLSGTGSYALNQYGTCATNNASCSPGTSQTAHGTALGVGYEGGGMRVDIGTTPQDFPVSYLVGGIKWSHYTETSGFSFDVSRRAVTSSLLSYAGARDPVSGEVWGGVHSSGAAMHISRDSGRLSGSVDMDYHWLAGTNVQSNTEFALRIGSDWSFIRNDDMRLTAGLALSDWHYREDLSNYSFGQGGYYSPQQNHALSLPVRWTGRENRWSYLLQGTASVSVSYNKDMLYYPTRPDLQQAAIANGNTPIYTGGNSHGFYYSLAGAVEHQVTPQLYFGARAEIDRTAYYSPNTAVVYLRYMFTRETGAVPYPPEPVKPYSQY
jgi:tetratricopeptide (TPR) repeat protein